jgi:hypothetical protein
VARLFGKAVLSNSTLRQILVDVFAVKETHKDNGVIFQHDADAVVSNSQPEIVLASS